jgi:hypothetical protein
MVMGGETEYAVSAETRQGGTVPQHRLIDRCWHHAMQTLGYTSRSIRGRFLRNGGLIYSDCNLHLEYSTPETTSPFEVVRYLAAGDRIMWDVVTRFAADSGDIASIFCSRVNVEYLTPSLWAAHESYGLTIPVQAVREDLTPFLASRVILGAGGWDFSSPVLRFTMSPRAHFLNRLADHDSQHVRPLFHTKDEPLSNAGHRLHVACGESLCSERANVLRFGTTALVAALSERHLVSSAPVTLTLPILAAQRFAADTSCRHRAPLAFGGRARALDIQRHYLRAAAANLGVLSADMPWAAEICRLWGETLDDLEAGGPLSGCSLDWAIKRRVFGAYLERRGLSWQELDDWHAALERLRLRWTGQTGAPEPFMLSALLDPGETLRAEMDRVEPALARAGLSWDGLPALLSARQELFELDARFASLGEDSVFASLDREGLLMHRVATLDVDDAVVHPPADTRAKVRGDVVWRLSQAGTPYGAEWFAVYDRGHNVELVLDDPRSTEERWRPIVAGPLADGTEPARA